MELVKKFLLQQRRLSPPQRNKDHGVGEIMKQEGYGEFSVPDSGSVNPPCQVKDGPVDYATGMEDHKTVWDKWRSTDTRIGW